LTSSPAKENAAVNSCRSFVLEPTSVELFIYCDNAVTAAIVVSSLMMIGSDAAKAAHGPKAVIRRRFGFERPGAGWPPDATT
jgi:hypothetical protein